MRKLTDILIFALGCTILLALMGAGPRCQVNAPFMAQGVQSGCVMPSPENP